MDPAKSHLRDLLFGQMKGQILGTGIKLGVFEVVDTEPKPVEEIITTLDIDPNHGYRFLRALSHLGVVNEAGGTFSLTSSGKLLTEDHPHTFKDYFLLEVSQMNYSLWSQLPSLIEDGEQNTYVREFGEPLFDYLDSNPEVASLFNDAMESYSRLQGTEIQELLNDFEITEQSHICDIAGGYGYLLCDFLSTRQSLTGTVFEQPEIVEQEAQHLATEFGVADRCSYVAGDMFEAVPSADVYFLKHIIHDWSDTQAIQILTTIREHAPDDAQLVLLEHVLPESNSSHFGALYDIQMIVWTTGRERTPDEYASLLEQSGWEHNETTFGKNNLLGAIKATPT
ncbi:methyltransferase [Natrialba taiwanensis]|nr:methyltransferase [Natrialba taiwanensis]